MSVNEDDKEIESKEEEEESPEVIQLRKDQEESRKKLAGEKPLKTLFLLMIGPFMQQISSALYGIFSTVWVSMGVGPIGVTAISTYTTFDAFGRCCGFFLCTAAATQISALFGAKKSQEAPQVVCDLLRVAVFMGVLVPSVLCPTVNIACRWFGAGDEVVALGYDYLLPILVTSVITCINVACTGFLQAEGKTLLIGLVAMGSLIGSMCVFGPLFVLAFKWGMTGAGVSTVMSDAIPGVTFLCCYFGKCFLVKPKFSGLIKKFSPYTFKALRVGASQLVSNLGMVVPGIVIRKLIGQSVTGQAFNDALAGYAIIFRYQMVINCVCIAVSSGFIPAASYAYAAKNYRRYWRLVLHAAWISQTWSLITNIFSWAIPKEVSKIFGTDPGYLKYAEPMLFNGNALGFLCWFRIIAQGILQSMQMGFRAMILSLITQLFSIIAFAYLLYYTGKNDPSRIIWCYPMSYALGVILGLALIIPELRRVYILRNEQRAREKAEEEEDMHELEDDENKIGKLDSSLNKTPNSSNESDVEDNVSLPSESSSHPSPPVTADVPFEEPTEI